MTTGDHDRGDDLEVLEAEMVIRQQLRKAGNSFVVTIPKEEVEREGWQEGQFLEVQLNALELRPVLGTDLGRVVDALIDEHEDALRYLAGR